jgi:hypothetical protein
LAQFQLRSELGSLRSVLTSGVGFVRNVLKAKEDLEKVRVICGTDCEAYRLLRSAIDGTVTY